ncbi:hypothetical protein LJC56_07500 [Christensenellaceae bacterium OttesenSCG-928-K19]|nr:hypothetical protein [Christensenellaceae bacterium OttesenSCG-928-K19]
MKKLIALTLIATLLLSGCSLFGGVAEDGGNDLSNRLAGLEHEEYEEPTPTPAPLAKPTPEPTAEPTPDPFSKEMLDPYNIRTFWDSSKNIDTYCEVMGLHYNSTETDRLLQQTEFAFEVYNGPFDYPLPGVERAECYAWASPSSGNVFRFDYKHYIGDDMSPEEVADLYLMTVGAFSNMIGKSPDDEGYYANDDDQGSFERGDIIEQVAANGERYSFRTLYGSKISDIDCQEVMLLKRDGVLSIFLRWYLPLETLESLQAQKTPTPSSSATNGSNSSSPAGKVIFSGLTTHDELPPGEGILEAAGFNATPNSSGGYDCSVTIANVSYAMESSIYCLLFALGSDDAMDLTLAEYDYFDKGAANTYHFTVPADMVASGDCEVLVEYTFW